MKVYVLARTGGADAREYEEGIAILGVYKDVETGREQFHTLVDEAIKDGGFSHEGMEDDHGTFHHKRPQDEAGGDEITYWEFNGELHMVDEYQCQYMHLSAEELE